MSVPPPPRRLRDPNYTRLRAGDVVHRVHHRDYGGAQANPCEGQPTRFAPIYDADGACIPTLYAASSVECALHESLFHGVDPRAAFKSVRRDAVDMRAHSEIRAAKRMELVSLFRPDLMRWGLARDDLVSALPKFYSATARWAEAIFRSFPRAQGLTWTSNRCDPDRAFVFFANRLDDDAWDVLSTRLAADDPAFLAEIVAAARRAGITIVK